MIYEKSEILGLHLPQVIRVKAKRKKTLNGTVHNEYRKFNFISQQISFDNLRRLLAKVFKLSGEFNVNYLSRRYGPLPLTSDFDLDGALLQSRNFCLKLEIQPVELDKGFDEWDIICPADIPPRDDETSRCTSRLSLAGSFLSQVGRKMQRAFSFERSGEFPEPDRMPMTAAEFENYCDSEGRIIRPRELHVAVFRGGVEPSLRITVWKHLLNIFPDGLTDSEREEYLSKKSAEYYALRDAWKRLIHNGVDVPNVLKDVVGLVAKDVRRTDRHQKFFSGSDDNKNTQSLFNILTTYGVNHQQVSYCQGMSDILSPILYVMKDEGHAYLCFCGLMKRIAENFSPDGRSMKRKFRHLRRMLLYYDRELFLYLKKQEALQLLFCYRWLVLELKREFAYDDALHVLEVMWGSLPPKSPEKEISLYDDRFPPETTSNLDSEKQDVQLYLELDDLSWDENHFSMTPETAAAVPSADKLIRAEPPDLTQLSYTDSLLAGKWASRSRRESQMRSRAFTESSVEDEDEGAGSVHCYRSHQVREVISRRDQWHNKSQRSIVSFRGVSNDEVLSNISDHASREKNQSHSSSRSLAFEASFKHHDEHKHSDLKQSDTAGQWCYADTVKELRRKKLLREENEEHIVSKSEACDKSGLLDANSRHRHGSSDSNYSTNSEDFSDDESRSKVSRCRSSSSLPQSKSEGYVSDCASASNYTSDYDDSDDDENDVFRYGIMDSMYGNHYEEALSYFRKKKLLLPPPHVLGDGNPFLLFLCLTMIESHREEILRRRLDFNELGMFFDKLVRKHKVLNVVCKARSMFEDYLNMGWNESLSDSDDDDEFEA